MDNPFDRPSFFEALEVGQFYLKFGRALLTARGLPGDMHNVTTGMRMSRTELADSPVLEHSHHADGAVLDVQEVLIQRSLKIERELSEGRNFFHTPASHRLVLLPRKDGHIDSTYGTVIEHNDGSSIVIDFNSPEIVNYLSGQVQGSTGDRVRVLSQIVGLLCDEVRFCGLDVGVLRDAVGLLGDAISAYRNSESGGATNKASGTETN